ncbi:MAG TPA: DNA recombination protein RmuC [Solirubrobacteraceae bacterium]|jgi:DNA recombination protein RmuC|nr:DNA recombination protein RmuC [Solirubrobacteraceae bacterium]
MSIVMLLIGVLLGGAIAAALLLGRVREERRLREAEQSSHRSQLDLLEASRTQLRDEMKGISAAVLEKTAESLTRELSSQRRIDDERAAGEMGKRAAELRGLVEPMKEKLGKVESQIELLERERRQSSGQMGEMFRQLNEGLAGLRAETGTLVGALKRPTTRGSWGEIQLRNVIEMAGMVAHCDFTEQTTIDADGGRLRPDVLVRLPGGKLIVVDSKVPLDAYLQAMEATTDEERGLHLARHARQTRDHITKLASKGYQAQLESSPELVVMFVPSDGIYHAALSEDPGLIEYGVDQQVLLATPTTLIGLLRAVHYGWKQELIAASAREIAETGRELHKRIARFVEPFARVGRQLSSAVGAYNEAVGSFEARVVPQLRRIEQAGAGSERTVEIAGVEEAPRALTAAIGELEPAIGELDPQSDAGATISDIGDRAAEAA